MPPSSADLCTVCKPDYECKQNRVVYCRERLLWYASSYCVLLAMYELVSEPDPRKIEKEGLAYLRETTGISAGVEVYTAECY